MATPLSPLNGLHVPYMCFVCARELPAICSASAKESTSRIFYLHRSDCLLLRVKLEEENEKVGCNVNRALYIYTLYVARTICSINYSCDVMVIG